MADLSGSETTASDASERGSDSLSGAHSRHCFVVMPFGRDRDERKWYRGWYEVVIRSAIDVCEYDPILSASEEQPGAINDEIRAHLIFDPMVVVDLGGMTPNDPPNPNVMYELGIRHAYGLPLVIMAWEGQSLPFDVGNQRAIMTARGFADIEPTRQKLIAFIRAAEEGRFYNPMEAVGREAALDATSLVLGEESLLGALTQEVRELRGALSRRRTGKPPFRKAPNIKSMLDKQLRAELWSIAQEKGFDSSLWSKFLRIPVSTEIGQDSKNWSLDEWLDYLLSHKESLFASRRMKGGSNISTEFIEQVALLLSDQPWPKGVHREVAEKLSASSSSVQRAIQELIKQGRFQDQIDGVLVEPEASLDISDQAVDAE